MASLTHILAATDLSTPARHAAQRAALLARQNGARLDLVHVAQQAPMARLQRLASAGSLPADLAQRLLDSAKARLQELADLLVQDQGVQAGVKTAVGDLLPTLQAEADAHQSSLVVLGSHGDSVLRHLVLGSTAERLLGSTTRPMLVVQQAPRAAYRSVLVPVDLSTASLRTIDLARAIAPGARLCLVHAFDLPFEGSLRHAGVSSAVVDQYRIAAHMQAEQQLNELLNSAGLPTDTTLTVVQHGDAASRILQQAKAFDADLIVMGKHSDGMLQRLFMGSVTRRVLSSTEIDVLVSV